MTPNPNPAPLVLELDGDYPSEPTLEAIKLWSGCGAKPMSERDKQYWAKLKADPNRYAEYLERKRRQRKFRQESRQYETTRKRQWRAANPEDRKRITQAGHAVENALKFGQMVRPESCSDCGKPGKVEAHHHKGYAPEHRLDVIWLCVFCHRKAYKEMDWNI